ncbi:hypothetical protein G3496_03585 [Shewanella baltica]|uniref:hypothetical protein n=1 Tax=Shewanella baltica TaxID=62322 RepID=UPI00217F1AF7|nr:hypothetical protein [Shewanella baltica]MCS6134006.1 hypothetical protein [Shewanella baltica]
MHINSAIPIAQTSQAKPTAAATEPTAIQTNTAPVQQDTVTLSDEAKEKAVAETQGNGWGNEPKVTTQGNGWGNEPQ